jgi:hypothetical protein
MQLIVKIIIGNILGTLIKTQFDTPGRSVACRTGAAGALLSRVKETVWAVVLL